MDWFADARRLCRTATSQVDGFGSDRPTAVRHRKHPVSGPLGPPIQAQQLQQLGRQQGLPVLAAFALAHPQHVAAGVDVTRLELSRLRGTESAAVQHGQHGAVAKLAGRLQERFDFLPAQDQRQLSFAPWKRNAFDRDLAVQCVGIEKAQRADQLDASGLRCLFVLDQEQLVLANMLGAELVGWLMEVFGELGDRVQVKTDGGGRIVADLEILQHALPKWGHSQAPFASDHTTKRDAGDTASIYERPSDPALACRRLSSMLDIRVRDYGFT